MIPDNLSKNERIALKKKNGLLKDRHSRKLEKFSNNFNTIFEFFLRSYRKKLLNFGGIAVDVTYKKIVILVKKLLEDLMMVNLIIKKLNQDKIILFTPLLQPKRVGVYS